MCNGSTKWARLGFFNINVNPLMVARGIGKLIDLRLRNVGPGRYDNCLPHACGKLLECLENFHGLNFNPMQVRDQSPHCPFGLLQPPRALAQFDPT